MPDQARHDDECFPIAHLNKTLFVYILNNIGFNRIPISGSYIGKCVPV